MTKKNGPQALQNIYELVYMVGVV